MFYSDMKKSILLFLVFIPISLLGQWSNDPGKPLIIFNGYDLSDAEVISENDYYYFSWVRRPYGGPSYRMIQRISYEGYPVWSDSSNLQSVYGSLLSSSSRNIYSDKEGSLLVSQIRYDYATNRWSPVVIKISQTGKKIWSTYRELGRTGFDAYDIYLCISSLNNIFVITKWASEYKGNTEISLTRISAEGKLEWQDNRLLASDTINKIGDDFQIFPTNDDGCLVLYSTQTLSPSSSNVLSEEIRLRRISGTGLALWKRDEVVVKQRWGIFADSYAVQQGDDALYFLCHETPGVPMIYRESPDGTPTWGAYGQLLTDLPVFYMNPIISGFSPDGGIYLLYTNTTHDSVFLFEQKMSADGERLWGANGKKLISNKYGDLQRVLANTMGDTTVIICQMVTRSDYNSIFFNAMGISPEGNLLWNKTQIVSSPPDKSINLSGIAAGGNDQLVFSWMEFGENRQCDVIKAQNIHTNGTFGNLTSSIPILAKPGLPLFTYDAKRNSIANNRPDRSWQYFLFNSMGQMIIKGGINTEVLLPDLTPGIYFLTVIGGQHKESLKVLIGY
ncbi:MAG: T9SS C-terminal target domain-containing protein [Porphyromonadaceae bacterium]|nr:MAG: T9SS C-terminal target domain-containing protein [Porphyromonadaceae bacterium]